MNNLSNNNYCMGHDPYKTTLQTIGGDLQVQVDQDVHWETQDALHLQADEDIIFNAEDTLTLQCGNSTMTLEGGVVTYTSPDFGIGENPAAGPNTTFDENRTILPGGVLCPKNQPESGLSAQAFADAEQTHASLVRLSPKVQTQATPTVAIKEASPMPQIFSNAEGSELTEERIAAFVDEMDTKWLTVPKGQLTFDVEGKDRESSPYFSRIPHWPGGMSGITIGRGYDLGQQPTPKQDFAEIGLSQQHADWLLKFKGLKGYAAKKALDNSSTQMKTMQITRKQQYTLFMKTYEYMEKDVARISKRASTIRAYHPNKNISGEKAWTAIPQKIKDILVDLRYRGDYTTKSREFIQRTVYEGDLDAFARLIKNAEIWPRVPKDRFENRIKYLNE